MRYLAALAVCVLLVGCTGTGQNDVDRQLQGNQGVLLVLQNAPDLNNLYFYYNGPENNVAQNAQEASYQAYRDALDRGQSDSEARDAAATAAKQFASGFVSPSGSTTGSGLVAIGELNLLIQDVGSSATAGALYVSGYDPNLITVREKPGQYPPVGSSNSRNCFYNLGIAGTGQYDVSVLCTNVIDDISLGGQVNQNRNGKTDVVGTIFNLPIDEWANKFASEITGKNVEWFTQVGLFSTNRVDCGTQNGQFGCNIQFGNPAFNPNRASRGYLLLNLFYAQIHDCPGPCRYFPPDFTNGVPLHGVSDEYPIGDATFYDYVIALDRSKWNPLLNDLKQTFQVTACYLYTTTVTPGVCVDPDPTSNVNEPCSTTPIVYKGSQGAPIKVTQIDQESRPGATAFTIHVEHVGNGQVWLPGTIDQCSPYSPSRPDFKTMDAVQLLDVRIAGNLEQLQCVPSTNKERIIRLQNGKGQITCLYPVWASGFGSRAAYTSALTIELGYLYRNTIQKDVIIHRT